jgi:hypothetical protein
VGFHRIALTAGGGAMQFENVRTWNRWCPKISAEAKFLSFDFATMHILTYRLVDSLRINVPAKRWFDMGNRNFGSLLHDELTASRRQLMQHRFQFSSGARVGLHLVRRDWMTKAVRR